MFLSSLRYLHQYLFLNNAPEDWAAAGIALVATAAMVGVRALVLRHLRAGSRGRDRRRTDGLVPAMLSNTWVACLAAFGLYVGSTMLTLSHRQEAFMERMAIGALLLQAAIWGDTGLRA
jgi:hypothetical protein